MVKGINTITEIVQAGCTAPSIASGVLFFAGNQASKGLKPYLRMESFGRLSNSALDSTNRLIGNNLNTRWIAPISVMLAFSLLSSAFYVIPTTLTSFFVTGAVCGVHGLAMDLFANGSGQLDNIFSFKKSLREIFIDSDHLPDGSIKKKADIAGSLALLVSTVALTLLLKHPILAKAIAYPISVAVNVAAERFFRNYALIENVNPVMLIAMVTDLDPFAEDIKNVNPVMPIGYTPTNVAILREFYPETNQIITPDGKRFPPETRWRDFRSSSKELYPFAEDIKNANPVMPIGYTPTKVAIVREFDPKTNEIITPDGKRFPPETRWRDFKSSSKEPYPFAEDF